MDLALIKIIRLLLDITSRCSNVYLFRKAANLGMAKAFTKCGDFVYSGKGCGKIDKSEAFKCYQKAALLNDSEALNNIGLMLELGFEDRPSDPEQALEYYKRGHKLGNTDASINIAIYYLSIGNADRDTGKYLLK
jgi:TPR repeat protein